MPSTAARPTAAGAVAAALSDDTADAAVFAGDCNLRREEDGGTASALVGADAWDLAGTPEEKQWTWPAAAVEYLPAAHAVHWVSAASPVWLDQRAAEHWEHWSSEVAPGS